MSDTRRRRRRHNISQPGQDPAAPEREPLTSAPTQAAPAPAGEDIVDFEEADTVDADDLPLLARDLPAPLSVREDALSDELGAPRPAARRPGPKAAFDAVMQPRPAEPSAAAPAPPADAEPVLDREPAPVAPPQGEDDFEALLSRLDNVVGDATANGSASEEGRSLAREDDDSLDFGGDDALDLGGDDTLDLDGSDTFELADEDLVLGDDTVELSEEELDFGGTEEPARAHEDVPAAASDPAGPSLAENADFWATLEASDDESDEDLPPTLAVGTEPEAETERAGRMSVSLFGRRPEPESIDATAIERLKSKRSSINPLGATAADGSSSDAPAPLAVDAEQAEAGKSWRPPIHVAARQGVFAGPNALSLLTPNLRDDVDELNHALSAFAELEPGQKGFIRLSMRAYPEFKGESKAWLAARKSGVDPNADKMKPHQLALAWVKYGLSLLWFEANKANPSMLGGKAPPLQPGKRGDVKQLTAGQAGAEEAQAWKDAERKVLATPHYEVDLRIGVVGKNEDNEALERIADEVAAGFDVYSTTHQELVFNQADAFDTAIGCMGAKRDNVMLALSADEVGELARVPDDLTRPQGVNVKRSVFKQLPLSNAITFEDAYQPPAGIIPLGIISPRSEDARVFGMRCEELNQHMFYAGRTGTGKSELMKWLVFGVAKADYPTVIIDPHGALSEDVLNTLVVNCPERANDIVFCDLADGDFPVALNPLDVHSFEEIEPTVHSIMEMLDKQMNLGQSAPRARNLANQAIAALCEANLHIKDPDTKLTLLHMVTFFIDTELRRLVMEFCSNVSVRETFDPETGPFEVLSEKQQMEFAMPIIRAFQPLGSSDSFSAVFSAGENRLDFGKLIGANKILIVKLARFSHQKKLGEFVGSLILPWMLSTMDDWGRKRDPETGEVHGRGCRIFVDEAPTLIGPGSAAIQLLAEARKWDLGLVFTGQYLDQFDPSVIKAALANTASKISLTLEPSSARLITGAIADSGKVTVNDIAGLPRFHYYGNILLPGPDGASANSGEFSAACLPPINCDLADEHKALRDKVKERSRDLICNRKQDIAVKRMSMLEHIKGALGQLLIDRADNAENPMGGSDYAVNLDPLDDNRTFGGW